MKFQPHNRFKNFYKKGLPEVPAIGAVKRKELLKEYQKVQECKETLIKVFDGKDNLILEDLTAAINILSKYAKELKKRIDNA